VAKKSRKPRKRPLTAAQVEHLRRMQRKAQKTNTKHGHARKGNYSTEYTAWQNMKARCYNPNHPYFPYYGKRGITVCKRWRGSFKAFLADMGPKPSRKRSIDRIDNDGIYKPSNCHWGTGSEQIRNRRLRRIGKYGFRGVHCRHCHSKRYWWATIMINGKNRYLGCFDSVEKAARAYDAALIEHFGKSAAVNFPTGARKRKN
jgi:hypothetical protein